MPVTRFTPRQILAGLLAGLLAVAAGAHAAAPSKPLQPRPTYQRTPPKPPERAEFAYVEAEAGCVIKGNRLDVTASVAQGPRLGAGPYVWGVTFYIEQRLAGKADFVPVGNALPAFGFPYLFPPLEDEDDVREVAVQSFRNFCNVLSPEAEWIRGAVVIEIVNGSPNRPDGALYAAQCTSMRNPCR